MDTELERQKILLNYYQEQSKYRHGHFWSLISSHILLCGIIIIFPYVSNRFDIEQSAHIGWIIYRVAGVSISALFVYLLLCESARMKAQTEAVKVLINEIGGGKYEYPQVSKVFRMRISYALPFVIFAIHILLAVLY